MMTVKIQIIIAVIVVLGLCYIVNLIRKDRLELKYSLSWLVIGLVVLVLDCFPVLMNKLADLVGIASPVNLMFFIGFLFSLLIILTLTVALSIAASSVKRLTQKCGLLDKKIKELEEKIDKNTDKKE